MSTKALANKKTPEARIKFCQEQMLASEFCFVEQALEAGDILNAQKAKLDHGEWLDWLDEHWTRSNRTAQEFMRISADVPRQKALECSSIKEVKELAKCATVAHLDQEPSGKQPFLEDNEPDTDETPADSGPAEESEVIIPEAQGAPESAGVTDSLEDYTETVGGDRAFVQEVAVSHGETLSIGTVCRWLKTDATEADADFIYSILIERFKPSLDSALNDWARYRKELKKPLTPTGAKQVRKRMLALDESEAIAMIEYTISQGWQGLREPEAVNGKASGPVTFSAQKTKNILDANASWKPETKQARIEG